MLRQAAALGALALGLSLWCWPRRTRRRSWTGGPSGWTRIRGAGSGCASGPTRPAALAAAVAFLVAFALMADVKEFVYFQF